MKQLTTFSTFVFSNSINTRCFLPQNEQICPLKVKNFWRDKLSNTHVDKLRMFLYFLLRLNLWRTKSAADLFSAEDRYSIEIDQWEKEPSSKRLPNEQEGRKTPSIFQHDAHSRNLLGETFFLSTIFLTRRFSILSANEEKKRVANNNTNNNKIYPWIRFTRYLLCTNFDYYF